MVEGETILGLVALPSDYASPDLHVEVVLTLIPDAIDDIHETRETKR